MKNKLLFLDGLRGLAALYVVIHHARWVLWEGYLEGYLLHPEKYSTIQKCLMYFFASFKFGHEAVVLFFVLSGFVIHLRYSKEIVQTGTANFIFKEYFIRRSRRIFPTLLLALFVTFVLDSIGLYLKLPLYFLPIKYTSIAFNLQADHSISTLIGNLFLLMKIYVPVWGTNGPLWSLALEWWFYMFYPLFLWLGLKKPWLPVTILSLLFMWTEFGFMKIVFIDKVFSSMIVWWLGSVLCDIYTGRIKLSFYYLSPLILVIPFLLVSKIIFPQITYSESVYYLCWGIGFMGLFSVLFLLDNTVSLGFLEKIKPLGDISYSLYLLHMPVLTLFSAILMSLDTQMSLPKNFQFVFVGTLLSLLVGYLGYVVSEKPFLTKRKIISAKSSQDKVRVD